VPLAPSLAALNSWFDILLAARLTQAELEYWPLNECNKKMLLKQLSMTKVVHTKNKVTPGMY